MRLYLIIAMDYCIEKKRENIDPEYEFCLNALRTCKSTPKMPTPKRKILYLVLKFSPSLIELVCIFSGKKYS